MTLSNPESSNFPFSRANQEEDRRLWQSLRKGNELGFSSLYKKYINSLFNYGMHLHPEREEIKEILQELFSKLWITRDSLREVDQVNFYLYSCFRNALFKRLKEKSKFFNSEQLRESDWEEQSMEAILVEEENFDELKFSVSRAIDLLSPRQKEIVILRFYQGLSHEQIALLMGISKEGVYNLLSRALGILKIRIKRKS